MSRANLPVRHWRRLPIANVVRVPDTTRDLGVLKVGRSCLAAAGIACRSCVDVCPVRALRIVRLPGNAAVLELDNSICVLCGDCVRKCPVDTIELTVDAA